MRTGIEDSKRECPGNHEIYGARRHLWTNPADFEGARQVTYDVIYGEPNVIYGAGRHLWPIWIEATPENARRLLDAFLEARLGTAALTTVERILSHEITIFNERLAAHLVNSAVNSLDERDSNRKEVANVLGAAFQEKYGTAVPRPRELREIFGGMAE